MSDPITPTAIAVRTALTHASISALGVPATQIYSFLAPSNRVWPYILLECLDAPEEDRTFGGRTWTRQWWKVSVVTEEDAELALQISGAVNALLDNAEFAIAGYRNLCCLRIRPLAPRPVEGTDQVVRYHAGGEYTIGVGEPA